MSKRILMLTCLGVASLAGGHRHWLGSRLRRRRLSRRRLRRRSAAADFGGERRSAAMISGGAHERLGRRPFQRRGLWRRTVRRRSGRRDTPISTAAADAPTRGNVNHFLGLPSDEGFHQLAGGGANVAGRAVDGAAAG